MFDILGMQINLSPDVVRRHWSRIRPAFEDIERKLPEFNDTQFQYLIENHPLGGFLSPLAEDSPLDKIFREQDYSIKVGGVCFTRGANYYPGLFSRPDNLQTISSIMENVRRLALAYDQSISGMWVLPSHDTVCAFLDYARNYLLILLYANNTIIRYIDPEFNDLSGNMKKLITELDYLLYVALKEDLVGYFGYTYQLNEVFRNFIAQIKLSKARDSIVSRHNLIRESREIDSLSHIFRMAELVAEGYLPNDTILVGLEYGGIELPFAVNAIRYYKGKSVQKIGLVHLSQYSKGAKYSNPALGDLFLNDSQAVFLDASHVFLLDDSVTTARSIELFSNLAIQYQKTMSVAIVAFKSSHRYHHLIMRDHGCINPVVLGLMTVLCQANYASTYKDGVYTNRSGVFDINKHELHRILGLL